MIFIITLMVFEDTLLLLIYVISINIEMLQRSELQKPVMPLINDFR